MTLLTFGQFIQMKREAMGLTKTEVTRRMGAGISNYSLWESDRTKPSAKTVAKLVEFFKISEEEMIPYIDNFAVLDSSIMQSKPHDKPIAMLLRQIDKCRSFIDQYMSGESTFELGIKSRALQQLGVFEREMQKLALIDDAFCG